MQRFLTIVGSSARAAAVSAARSGFIVHAADLFADTDLCSIAQTTQVSDYPAGLGRVIAGQQAGCWLYTGALENHPELVDAWAKVRPLWGNSGEVLRAVRNPSLIAAALAHQGLRTPLGTSDVARVPADGTWLLKPLKSGGGQKIATWFGADTAIPQGDSAPSDGWYFQQRISGRSCSAVFLAAERRAVLLGVTEQLIGGDWAGGNDFRYCGSVGPIPLSDVDEQELRRIGSLLAQDFDLVGLWGVDFVMNTEGVWLIEVNPRLTASVEVLERATGLDAIELHAMACGQRRLPTMNPLTVERVSGKSIVFAPEQVRFPSLATSELRATFASRFPLLADVPAPGTFIEQGWPIATVLADGVSIEEVRTSLRHQSRRLLTTCMSAQEK